MKRAAVIIGVNQVGNLPKLNAAVASAVNVAKWAAKTQEFEATTLITDEPVSEEDVFAGGNTPSPEKRRIKIIPGKEVTVDKIKTAIRAVVDSGTFDQLFVYFSGHGVNIRYDEYWLLSGAPEDTQEAVNVSGSVVLARRVGIPHIVLVSDACRTAAEGIQAQFVTGSEIFPNAPAGGVGSPVDQFYATTLGAPALEIRDSRVAADSYRAIYTDTLLDCLNGRAVECVERVDEAGVPIELVRPWPLRYYLETEVPRRLRAAAVSVSAFQVPDALITSPPPTWLARILVPQDRPTTRGAIPPTPPTPPPVSPQYSEPEMAFLGRRIAALENQLGTEIAQSAADVVAKEAQERASPFGRGHFETRCGFKVRGARFVEAYYPRNPFNLLLDGPVDSVAVHGGNQQVATKPTSIMLTFDNRKSTILPAIPEFVTALTVKEGQLVDVVYEPADTSPRWPEYQSRADQIRQLRGRIAAAAQFGVFRLEGQDGLHLARKMQLMKGLDPTMALYAAYAYDGLQQTERIIQMQNYLIAGHRLPACRSHRRAWRIQSMQIRRVGPALPSVRLLLSPLGGDRHGARLATRPRALALHACARG